MMSSMCEGIDNAKKEKPMKPELKLGRPVLAYNTRECDAVKAKYVCGCSDGHMILIQGAIEHRFHAKPDLAAPPMNGDEVECSDDKINWDRVFFIGKTKNQRYITESFTGEPLEFKYVRLPQPSKRDRVEDVLDAFRDSKLWKHEAFVEIDKIYREYL